MPEKAQNKLKNTLETGFELAKPLPEYQKTRGKAYFMCQKWLQANRDARDQLLI